MSERVQRARTLSEEVRETSKEVLTSGAPCAENLYVCSKGETAGVILGGEAPRLLVCLSHECPLLADPLKKLAVVHVPIDAPADILDIPDAVLKQIFRRVDAARKSEGTAVIQCDSGRARSVYMAAAYLLRSGMTPRDSLLAVARTRPCVDCPLGAVAMFENVAKKVSALVLVSDSR
jgi:hypothetical protein